MFQVIVKNRSKENKDWKAEFPTFNEAQEWLNLQKTKSFFSNVLPEDFIGPIDLKQVPEWVEKDVQEKRKKEYPSIDEVTEALIEAVAENRPQKLNQIQILRQAIKDKYPKITKGNL